MWTSLRRITGDDDSKQRVSCPAFLGVMIRLLDDSADARRNSLN